MLTAIWTKPFNNIIYAFGLEPFGQFDLGNSLCFEAECFATTLAMEMGMEVRVVTLTTMPTQLVFHGSRSVVHRVDKPAFAE